MKKPKILLVEPPVDFWRRPAQYYVPNPGTLAIGSYMKQQGYDVKIIDTYADGIRWPQLKAIIASQRPDIVGASTYTPEIYARILMARMVKSIDPSIVTVFGGSHMSLVPEETLRLSRGAIDYGVIGEGEITFLDLVRTLETQGRQADMSRVKGIAYLRDGEFVLTERRPLIENLDDLPMPDYSLLPMDKYRNCFFPGSPAEGISCHFSRGCTSRCSFCSETLLWEHVWRSRSPASVVEELTLLNRQFGKKSFLINDDNFLHSRSQNIEFIERMYRSGLQIVFRANARVDTLLRDRDLLKDLRRIGMAGLLVGVESLNQRDIDGFDKGYDTGKIAELAGFLKEADIPLVTASFIVGHYDQTKEAVRDIPRTAYRHSFGFIFPMAFAPWPGTKAFREARERGLIESYDYRKYDFKNAVAASKDLNVEELRKLRNSLFYRWWFSPRVFLRDLRDRYRRHIHFYYVTTLLFTIVSYHLLERFRLGRFLHHNRMIDAIYREHMELLGEENKA